MTAERPTVEDKKLRVILASLDQNVESFAREAAHEKLDKKNEGPIWKRIAKNAWNGLTREYQLVKATQEARKEILENDNLLHHQGKSDENWREATTMRYSSEYGEQLIHEGETFHKLNSPEAEADPNAQRITSDIQDLHRRAARGEFVDDASLEIEVDRLRESWHDAGISQEYVGEGQFLANNVARSCRELEGMINSVEGLSALDREALAEKHIAEMEVIAGEARVGSRAEMDSTLSEKIAEKLRNVPFLSEDRMSRVASILTNEAVVAAMMSGAIYAAKRGASLAGKIIAPGIGAGVVAAIRQRNALKSERALESRRADAGKEAAEAPDVASMGTGRKLLRKVGLGKSKEEYRAELNATEYESRPAGELLGEIGGLYTDEGELNIKTPDDLQRALTLLGQTRARIQIGDRTDARLINFADISPEEMETRRFDLDLAMAKLEDDMDKLMKNPVAQAMLDIKPDANFEASYDEQRAIAEGMLMGEMQQQDQLFNKLLRKRAFDAAWKGTLFGMGLGAAAAAWEAAQEAYQHLRGSISGEDISLSSYATTDGGGTATATPDHLGTEMPDHLGTPEPDHLGTPSGPDHLGTQTPDHLGTPTEPDHLGTPTTPVQPGTGTPDHLGTQMPDHLGTPEHIDAGDSEPISDTSKMNLPEGYKVEQGGNNTVTITGPDGKEYSDLSLNPDGSLSDNALQTLKSHGFSVSDHQEVIQGKPVISHETVSPNQFYENHKDSMTTIHRTKWIDGDTARTGLHEFTMRNHVDANGNVIISLSQDGSLHGASGVNWQGAAQQHNLEAYVTLRGSQLHGLKFEFGPDGTATIPNGSEARALFDANGQMKVDGFVEAALNGGKAPDGGENIAVLATAVGNGNGNESIQDTIQAPTLQTAHVYTVQAPAHTTPGAGLTAPVSHPSVPATPASHTPSPPGVSKAEGLADAAIGAAATLGLAGAATGGGVVVNRYVRRRAAAAAGGTGETGTGASDNTTGEGTPGGNETGDDNDKNKADTDTGDATGGPETMSPEDQKYLDELDAEKLDTVTGYDFAEYARMGDRERKQAMRFINQAIGELGPDDKVKVVERAQQLAQEAQSKATSTPMTELFKNTMDVLQKSAERVERDATKGPKANKYLNDLDSETADFPFMSDKGLRFNADSYSPEVQKLVARIYKAAQDEAGPRPDVNTDPDGYNAWYKDVFRRVQRIAHPDQYPDLTDEQKDWFTGAQQVFSTVRSRYVRR